ncbi:hypothetical protein P8452_70531 [Trifolium repens]|nr:hypothetical protein P8452_70531 [Trifolium repens]
MAKAIVRLESPDDPGKRSRLWFQEDIIQVLEENIGTSAIKTIYLICITSLNDSLKKFLNVKILNFDEANCLTEIPDIAKNVTESGIA